MRGFITHWLVLAAALAATAWILPGVEVTSVSALLVAALVLGFLNAILKPILVVLTLPITVVTLGIFYFVLNALLFGLASKLVHGFVVHGFGAAFLGALLMSVLSWGIGSLVKRPASTGGA
jgi:putative membrane protein